MVTLKTRLIRAGVATGAAVVLLLVLCAVLLSALLMQSGARADEQDYRACVETRGLHETSDVDEIAAIADSCHRSVYGGTK